MRLIRPKMLLVAGISLFLTLAFSACTNVCEKFAKRVDECLVEFCEQHPNNPLCTEDARDTDNDDVGECPTEQRAMYELLLERSCDQLAREMGWEALNTLPP